MVTLRFIGSCSTNTFLTFLVDSSPENTCNDDPVRCFLLDLSLKAKKSLYMKVPGHRLKIFNNSRYAHFYYGIARRSDTVLFSVFFTI